MRYFLVLILLVSPAFAEDYIGVHVPLDELVMESGESFSKFFTREKNFDEGTNWVLLPLRQDATAADREPLNAAIKIAERFVSVVAVLIDPNPSGAGVKEIRNRLSIPMTTYLLHADDTQSQADLATALSGIREATLSHSAIILDRDWRILQVIPVNDSAALKAALAKMDSGFKRVDRWLPIFIAFSIGFCVLCGAIFYQKITEKESPVSAR